MANGEMAPAGALRLLPAAVVPADVVGQVHTALGQLVDLLQSRRQWSATRAGRHALGCLAEVHSGLLRHTPVEGEDAVLTKDALLELLAALATAGDALGQAGCVVGSFAAAGLEGRLLERLVDAQPMAPA
jgi:hypothetical protein